jgi:hypothetical protein
MHNYINGFLLVREFKFNSRSNRMTFFFSSLFVKNNQKNKPILLVILFIT